MADGGKFWNHPYYKMMKDVTTFMGQWPYQSMRRHITMAIITFSILSMMLTVQISAFWVNRHNMEVVLDCSVPFVTDLVLVTKYANNCYHYNVMIELFEKIKCNWTVLPKNNGLHILHDYSAFGRKFVKIYMMAMWFSCVSYITEPLQERLTVHLLYPNVTLPKRFSMPFEFGPINVDTWYYQLWCATSFGILTRLTVIGSTDLIMFTFSEHANGLLKGLGYAIDHLPPRDDSTNDDECYEYMKRCAMIHGRAIEFAENVRDIYLWSFLGIVGLNMILISITGVQIVNSMDNWKKMAKFVVNLITQIIHLFADCFVGQRVMDASSDLKETITNAKWYNASLRTQKLIPLMLLRAQHPVVLTAGKVVVMGMNTFATVLKTAASYVTVFLAMQ
ncbi:odorant receptor 63a-like [Diachasmimorpha longicaudata]|uniref:odorant receptor 63a-like n=1 Tax=Diachasmimorpha longicaudata TaxID=58733 RepID=UPI0030B8EB7C